MKLLQILKNRKKILGQNARNHVYIKSPGSSYGRRVADDKLLTKEVLSEYNVDIPQLIGIIRNLKELRKFDWDSLPKSMVMKPVHGSQGDGIEIFYNRDKQGAWIRGDGSRVDLDEIKRLAQDIVDGRYSLNKQPDQVLFEERIRPHKDLKNYTYKGTPDIRVVVFNNIPIQAYIRFPTKESEGKANMAIGAVGTGIDLSTGITTSSRKGKENGGKGSPIEYVAGTKLSYRGLKIPHWNKLLELSVKCQQAAKLKLIAIDFLIDDEKGPVVVELNARPGLSIQLVNNAGLAWRLNRVKGLNVKTIQQGIRIAQDLFGGEIEQTIERVSGKEVISNVMPVKINFDDKEVRTLALIDTSKRSSIIDSETAIELGIIDEEASDGEYLIKNVKIALGSKNITSTCMIVPKLQTGYKLSIGRKDLGDFIIDIKKVDEREESELRREIIAKQPKTTYKKMDDILFEISKKVSTIKMTRPTNYYEEKQKFFDSKFKYNPQFKYKPLRFDADEFLQKLNRLNPPNTEIGKLYKSKIEEIRKTIFLIESIGKGSETFTRRSMALFGKPSKKNLKLAHKLIHKPPPNNKTDMPTVSIEEVKEQAKNVFKKYNLNSKIVVNDSAARASLGKSTGKLTISRTIKWTPISVKTLIAHEIETHAIKLANGNEQKYGIFKLGTAGYLSDEEGIATIMKRLVMKTKVMWRSALKYFLINFALEHSFVETFVKAQEYLDDTEDLWSYVYRLKRGISDTSNPGVFTKDQYFGWTIDAAQKIINLDTNDLDFLFNGKGRIHELKKYTEKTSRKYPTLTKDKIKEFLEHNLID